MIVQILSKRLTLYIFLSGFIFHFFIFLIKSYSLPNVVLIGIVGGIVFVGIWAAILVILSRLLTAKEMSYYFQLSSNSQQNESANTFNDEDDLTIGDLYNFGDDVDNINNTDLASDILKEFNTEHKDIDNNDTYTPTLDSLNPDIDMDADNDILTDKITQDIHLDKDGMFNLTANGKTLKATPQDGAGAIKKVLHDQ